MKRDTHFDIYKYKIIFTNKIKINVFKVSNVVLIVEDCSYFNEDLNSFLIDNINNIMKINNIPFTIYY